MEWHFGRAILQRGMGWDRKRGGVAEKERREEGELVKAHQPQQASREAQGARAL